MCIGGGAPSAPAPPPLPPPAPPPPTQADPAVVAARNANKQTAALASGRASTILTSAQGLDDAANPLGVASTTKKTALGS